MKKVITGIMFGIACNCLLFSETANGMKISTPIDNKEGLSVALSAIKDGNISEFQNVVSHYNISLKDNLAILVHEAIENKNKEVLKFVMLRNSTDNLVDIYYRDLSMPLYALESGDIEILDVVCNRKYVDVLSCIAKQKGWSTVIKHAMFGCNADTVNFLINQLSENDLRNIELDFFGLYAFGCKAPIDNIKALCNSGKSWLSAKALTGLLIGAYNNEIEDQDEEKVLYLIQLLKSRGVNKLDELDDFCNTNTSGLRVDLESKYNLGEALWGYSISNGKENILHATLEWMTDTYFINNFSDFCRYACGRGNFKSIEHLFNLHKDNYKGLSAVQIDIGHGLPDLLATVDIRMTKPGEAVQFTCLRQEILKEEQLDVVKRIVQLPVFNVNAQDKQSNTAAHYAIAHGDVNVLKLILTKSDVDLSIKNRENKTARDLLIERVETDNISSEKIEEFKSATKEMEKLINAYYSSK